MDSEISDRNADISAKNAEISNESAGKVNIPFIAFESVCARNERQMKRLWIAVILLVVLLFVSNALWLWAFTGYDFENYEVDMDAGNGNALYNYIGEDGDINNGTNTGETAQSDTQERSEGQAHKSDI